MTNSEYFEKNKIPFAEAMEIFNKQKSKKGGIESFDKFLASEHVEPKFKVGDIVVLQRDRIDTLHGWEHNAVLKIVKINESDYTMEFLTPDGWDHIGDTCNLSFEFAENTCVLY